MRTSANGFAYNKKLNINNKKIKTPILFFGQPINGTPNPWDYFNVEGVLYNAYHILKNSNIYDQIIGKESLTSFLNLDKKTVLMVDSGGFLFQKRSILNFDCRKIINLYKEIKPDLGVVLDHPFSPTLSEKENVSIRWKKTLENTKIMLSEEKSTIIFPVIHGYSTKRIKKSWNDIKNIIDETNYFKNKNIIVGIGSLVPLMMTSSGAKNGKKLIVDLVLTLRQLIPTAHIHAFGIGGATTALIMYYLGVDSLDSVSWRLKAAKGALQLPGVSDRFISPPKGRSGLSEEEEELLDDCKCPICCNKNLEDKKFQLGPRADSNFENRSIHNAWIFQQEVSHCRNAIEKGNFEKFIEERLRNSTMKSMFNYARHKIKSNTIDNYY